MTPAESRLRNQPKYKIGQSVEVKVITKDEKSLFQFENKVIGFISVIRASGTDMKDTYEYGITTDLPGCYHNGNYPFDYILEDKIVLCESH